MNPTKLTDNQVIMCRIADDHFELMLNDYQKGTPLDRLMERYQLGTDFLSGRGDRIRTYGILLPKRNGSLVVGWVHPVSG